MSQLLTNRPTSLSLGILRRTIRCCGLGPHRAHVVEWNPGVPGDDGEALDLGPVRSGIGQTGPGDAWEAAPHVLHDGKSAADARKPFSSTTAAKSSGASIDVPSPLLDCKLPKR